MKKYVLGATLVVCAISFAANGDAYTWPTYRSDLDYDTRSNLGEIKPPTKFNENCSGVTGRKAGKWWALYWGKDRDARITDVTIDSILKKYDTDFTYLYDTLGWAPDAQAQKGQYSAVYYYGSGTCAGGAKTDTTGGWQTVVAGYTAVAASFYPLYSFNTSCPYRDRVSQMDAMIHEGIHSMTNGYPGAKQAHWFQEAGNTWIQQDMFSHREGVYSGMGFLNAATVIAPFMPIECYSGWLVDGTFGGPGAQGVTGKNQRYLLGGAQYSNIFPTFLGTWLGTGSVRWIYGNAYGKTTYLLETYALDKGLGAAATRRLITEFRARMALLDMKKWSNEIKNLLNNNFGGTSYEEQYYWDNGQYRNTWKMTPYQPVTVSDGYLIPDEATTPGWSGSNVVPLKVSSGAKQVKVSFYNVGGNSNNTNMNYLLCYRATDGTPVYSEPITGEGSVTLRLDKTPSTTNGSQMVFAVVVNTDYQYSGNENIRTKHFNYKLKLEEGLAGAGDANVKYYNNFVLDYKWPEITDNITPVTPGSSSSKVQSSSSVMPNSSSSIVSNSSSSVASSSSINVKVDTVKYELSATVQISEDYGTSVVDFDVQKVATNLGLAAADLGSATFFAVDADGSLNTNSTANAPGHWFGKNGEVVSWGENAYVFAEWNLNAGKISLGHYPNRVSAGDTYTFAQGLRNGSKMVVFKIVVNIANDADAEEPKDPSDGSMSVAFTGNAPARNMSLKNRRGVLEIKYSLPRQDNVKISLYSGFGGLLYQNISAKSAGNHVEYLNLANAGLPQGTYIVKVSTGSYREIRSITMVK